MNRTDLEKHINDVYSSTADHPWFKAPNHAVFRHQSNNKWFAIVMDVPKSKLGLDSDDIMDIVNVKCDYIIIESFLQQEGFFPAYHMNKTNWISIALDGSVDADTIKWLLDMSFDLTKGK